MAGLIDIYTFTQFGTTGNYSAIAILHTLQFTVAHALEFCIFIIRILTTDFSQAHCNFISHVKSFWDRLFAFLPVLQLPIPRLLSTSVVYSAVLRLLLPLLPCRTLLIITSHGPCTENTCHVIATQAVHWRAGCCLATVSARTYRIQMSRDRPIH
jgi:hypothetical protein